MEIKRRLLVTSTRIDTKMLLRITTTCVTNYTTSGSNVCITKEKSRQGVEAKRARDTNYYRKMGLLKDRASILMTSELLSKSLFDRFFGEVHRSGH